MPAVLPLTRWPPTKPSLPTWRPPWSTSTARSTRSCQSVEHQRQAQELQRLKATVDQVWKICLGVPAGCMPLEGWCMVHQRCHGKGKGGCWVWHQRHPGCLPKEQTVPGLRVLWYTVHSGSVPGW